MLQVAAQAPNQEGKTAVQQQADAQPGRSGTLFASQVYHRVTLLLRPSPLYMHNRGCFLTLPFSPKYMQHCPGFRKCSNIYARPDLIFSPAVSQLACPSHALRLLHCLQAYMMAYCSSCCHVVNQTLACLTFHDNQQQECTSRTPGSASSARYCCYLCAV